MKLIIALFFISSFAQATELADFECVSLDASYIFKLDAVGTIDFNIQDETYQEASAMIEFTLTDAGYDSNSNVFSSAEFTGKSRLVVGHSKFPFHHVQMKPTGDSEIALVNLSIGFPNPMSSFVRLKSGHEYRGKCEFR